jgi:hypothetical protein
MIQSGKDGSELRPINQYPVCGVQRPGYTRSHVTPGFHSTITEQILIIRMARYGFYIPDLLGTDWSRWLA